MKFANCTRGGCSVRTCSPCTASASTRHRDRAVPRARARRWCGVRARTCSCSAVPSPGALARPGHRRAPGQRFAAHRRWRHCWTSCAARRATGLLDDGRLEAAVGEVAARARSRARPGSSPASRARSRGALSRPLFERHRQADVELVVAERRRARGRAASCALGAMRGPRVAAPLLGGVTRWIDRRPWKSGETMNRSARRPGPTAGAQHGPANRE